MDIFFSTIVVLPDCLKCRLLLHFFFNFSGKGSIISTEHCVQGIMGTADKPATGLWSSEGRRPVENSEKLRTFVPPALQWPLPPWNPSN